jgi:hypothetical protein
MKMVLGIVGSPRHGGNTDILVARAVEGARSAGAETETIFLGDLSIKECDGCHACWTGAECPKRDDMNDIFRGDQRCGCAGAGHAGCYWYGPTAADGGGSSTASCTTTAKAIAGVSGKRVASRQPLRRSDPARPASGDFFALSLRYLTMEFAGVVAVGGMARKGQVLEREDALRSAADLGRDLVTGKGCRRDVYFFPETE